MRSRLVRINYSATQTEQPHRKGRNYKLQVNQQVFISFEIVIHTFVEFFEYVLLNCSYFYIS